MKQSQIFKRLLFMLPFVTMALLCGHGIVSARHTRTQSETSAQSTSPRQQLSPEGQSSLRSILQAGNLPDLRWPNFSDYDKHLQKFYESYGYTLPWGRRREPTAQAQQVIALLLKSEQKGLSAEGYDEPRWGGRLAKLKSSSPEPSEADALRIDIALTVSVMRYISDPYPDNRDFFYVMRRDR